MTTLVPLLAHWTLPAQEIHAVFTSPRRVPAKVTRFVDHLLPRFRGEWWAGESTAHGSFHAGKSAGPGV